jgi:hypothetical protein
MFQDGAQEELMSNTIVKLWKVTDGEWVPINPSPGWFRGFMSILLTKKPQELAFGDAVAPRTKYRVGTEEYVVQWRQ